MTRPAVPEPPQVSGPERLRRWRLVLGGGDADGTDVRLAGADRSVDAALGALYDPPGVEVRGLVPGRSGRSGGSGRSAPSVARWLGDVRRYFPTPVVRVLQRDAVDRLGLTTLLLEPELLETLEPDVSLAATLVELNRSLPDETRATARLVVGRIVDDLVRRLEERTRAAVHGALARSARERRPRPADIDWDATIRANLRHWLPEQRTVVPERLVGHGRRRPGLARDVIVAVDRSGSMADSVVYASVYAAVLARIPALRTRLVAFDTSVVDLTDLATDPVDVLFGVDLGGGTDLTRAAAYVERLVERPADTVVFLVSDLFDGVTDGRAGALLTRMVRSGVTLVCLLALSDDGAPAHDHDLAAELAAAGAHVLACTPDRFPDLAAQVLEKRSTSAR